MNIGFLGCGKIGSALLEEALAMEHAAVSFIQDPSSTAGELAARYGIPSIESYDTELYKKSDLVIESATSAVLKQYFDQIMENSDLMMFSVTAWADPAFEAHAKEMCRRFNRRIYIPHGAILGLDGIFDGARAWETVSIETIKSPASLGRTDRERSVVYQGSTREACVAYPRNVNVHAAVALAGIGFDRTQSTIISDPSVTTNTHVIRLSGEGISMELHISSFTTGGVTGKYTPLSACGSLRRVAGEETGIRFV